MAKAAFKRILNPPNLFFTAVESEIRAGRGLWLGIAAIAFLIRLPLILLPAPGRDEAVYAYWSQHPEWAYAPLLQGLVALTHLLPWEHPSLLRLPAVLAGFALLWAIDRWLRLEKIHPWPKAAVLAAVAFSPWQSYAGSILHPDNLMLLCMLLGLLAARREKMLWVALAAAGAFWAKPSGILVVIAFWAWSFWCFETKKALNWAGLVLLLIAPVGLSFSPQMIAAIAEFSKVPDVQPWWQSLILLVGTVTGLAGPILLLLPVSLRKWLQSPKRSYAHRLGILLGVIFTGGFLLAALFQGQIKGNWLLPGMVMLLLSFPPAITSQKAALSLAFLGLLFSLPLVIAMSNPALVRMVESRVPGWKESYGAQAGIRESRVSATASWSERLAEYQRADAFFDEVLARWRKDTGRRGHPAWILTDDYGLAAQMIYHWNSIATRLIVPADGVFWREMPRAGEEEIPGPGLLLGVQKNGDQIWGRLVETEGLGTVAHPQTAGLVWIGRSDGALAR